MAMAIGEVRQCPHCTGTGVCTQDFADRSCKTCVAKSGLDVKQNWDKLVCSVCGGKGAVWIGPDLVQLPSTPGRKLV